jgi:hypothetical protein
MNAAFVFEKGLELCKQCAGLVGIEMMEKAIYQNEIKAAAAEICPGGDIAGDEASGKTASSIVCV